MEKWEITIVTQTQQKHTLPAPSVTDAYFCGNKTLADHRDNSHMCVAEKKSMACLDRNCL